MNAPSTNKGQLTPVSELNVDFPGVYNSRKAPHICWRNNFGLFNIYVKLNRVVEAQKSIKRFRCWKSNTRKTWNRENFHERHEASWNFHVRSSSKLDFETSNLFQEREKSKYRNNISPWLINDWRKRVLKTYRVGYCKISNIRPPRKKSTNMKPLLTNTNSSPNRSPPAPECKSPRYEVKFRPIYIPKISKCTNSNTMKKTPGRF